MVFTGVRVRIMYLLSWHKVSSLGRSPWSCNVLFSGNYLGSSAMQVKAIKAAVRLA